MTHLKVTLTRSSIGADERQMATIRGLGLRKIGGYRVLENTPSVRGMVKSVMHLLTVQEVSNG